MDSKPIMAPLRLPLLILAIHLLAAPLASSSSAFLNSNPDITSKTFDVPRPAFPQFAFVDIGEVACLNGTGVPCAGLTQGQIHAWFQFGDDGLLVQYREDSALYNPVPGANQTVIYNREYSNLTEATYFFLAGSTSPSLQCYKTSFGYFNYSRFFLQDAEYIGITQPLGPLSVGRKAHTFLAKWTLHGMPIDVTAWVLVDQPDRIWGYHFLTIRYMLYHYYDMGSDGFDPSPFERPVGVGPCPNIGAPNKWMKAHPKWADL